MKNDNFVRSYSRAKKVFLFKFEMPFRAHQAIWATRNAFRLDGDFIESQAFGYLAIRSYLKKNISFPETTKVKKPVTGGEIVSNF